MTTRRSFMQMLGLAPAAAAASALPEGLAGVSPVVPGGSPFFGDAAVSSPIENQVATNIARKWFRTNGVPEEVIKRWKQERIESQRRMENFDADLQSAKSFSLATKRRVQTERLIEREIEREFGRWDMESFQETFRQKFGVGLPLNIW